VREQLGDAVRTLRARRSRGFKRQRHIARRSAPRQQRFRIVLEDDSDIAVRAFYWRATEDDLATGRANQSGSDSQGRRLAAARRPDHAHDLAPPDLQAELAEHEMVAEGDIDSAKLD
jgi:hypothetical protein